MAGPRKLQGIVGTNRLLNGIKPLDDVSPKQRDHFARHRQLVVVELLELREALKIHEHGFRLAMGFGRGHYIF